MKSPNKTYELSPGGTIWKNPHLAEKSELSDFTFEPISSSASGESTFSWDVSTDTSSEENDRTNTLPARKKFCPSVVAPLRHASGSSFKTVSISKTTATATTDILSIEGDKNISPNRNFEEELPRVASSPDIGETVFTFLENLFCCGFDTTKNDPKQARQKEVDNDFLGKIITCRNNTTCEIADCKGDYSGSEYHPISQ